MNVEIGTEVALFLSWKHINGIFVAVCSFDPRILGSGWGAWPPAAVPGCEPCWWAGPPVAGLAQGEERPGSPAPHLPAAAGRACPHSTLPEPGTPRKSLDYWRERGRWKNFLYSIFLVFGGFSLVAFLAVIVPVSNLPQASWFQLRILFTIEDLYVDPQHTGRLAYGRERGEGVGQEPNHTTARKPGLHSLCQHQIRQCFELSWPSVLMKRVFSGV